MTLREYLAVTNESCRAFAIRSKLSINTVAKLFHGKCVRKDVAKKIVRATRKAITLEDLGYETKKIGAG